ncbi:hypothetical protein KIW84_046453 [Lathyrus oleraceus]|uniref:Uncharacterized protein n=1 Tax=Pisum sativum TaxID=3888 RepID=A0A9D4XLE9_PEA|nr:hypothetical protein KIW84_046453 [Pisum sativum]
MSRRSLGSRTTKMEEFNSFIELMEVVDLPVVGNKHTWIKSYGSSSIRIGRFLLSGGLVNNWKIVAQVSGNRDISDHMLVWIKASNLNWGPKSFKVFNCWPDLDMIEFKNLSVEEKEGLEEMFTREEIKEVIFGCEGDRSPGPDGFNMEFIKRLRKVMGKIVSSNQTTLILGKQILDGVLVTNEIIDYGSREKNNDLLFKVDFA